MAPSLMENPCFILFKRRKCEDPSTLKDCAGMGPNALLALSREQGNDIPISRTKNQEEAA